LIGDREGFYLLPLPPNHTGGTPAYGSPVSGYPFGIDRAVLEMRL